MGVGGWCAAAFFEKSLALHREIGDQWGIAGSLTSLAVTALDQGDNERAEKFLSERVARLYGAAERHREISHTPLTPAERIDYERTVALARARLGEATFIEALAAGRALTLEQAIAEALQQDPSEAL